MGGNKKAFKAKTDFDHYVEELKSCASGRRLFTKSGFNLDVGLALYHLRTQVGMNVATCAERLGYKSRDIVCMEEGTFEFTFPLIMRIGEVFGKNIRVVFK